MAVCVHLASLDTTVGSRGPLTPLDHIPPEPRTRLPVPHTPLPSGVALCSKAHPILCIQ